MVNLRFVKKFNLANILSFFYLYNFYIFLNFNFNLKVPVYSRPRVFYRKEEENLLRMIM